ncbi:hypothetical protein AgCh_028207 [Apium graveolens]
MLPVEAVHVQRHSYRGVRYELDHMVESSFTWIPHGDSAPQAHDIPADELQLMSSRSPLIYMRIVEWCYTDRVTRQFGFLQQIPTASPHIGHHIFHGSSSGWYLSMENVVERWEHRHEGIIAAPTYMPSRRPMFVDVYRTWSFLFNSCPSYNILFAVKQDEGLSNVYHEIQRSEVAADDPIVDSALQGMEVTLDDTNFNVLQERRPHPPPMVPTGRRRPRTRGESTSLAFPHPRPALLDRYGHGHGSTRSTRSTSQHTYQGFGQTSHGKGFTGSPMEHTSQGHGSIGSHIEHTYQGFGQTTQDFHDRGFQPFMSHDTSGSRYASPIICEDDDDDDKEPHDVQVRQQPPRAVKGQGRICHTGGRYYR